MVLLMLPSFVFSKPAIYPIGEPVQLSSVRSVLSLLFNHVFNPIGFKITFDRRLIESGLTRPPRYKPDNEQTKQEAEPDVSSRVAKW